MFAQESVAAIAGIEHLHADDGSHSMEIDLVDVPLNLPDESSLEGFKYQEQRYGKLLTGSSLPDSAYTKLKSGLIDARDNQGNLIPPDGKGISLQEYFSLK